MEEVSQWGGVDCRHDLLDVVQDQPLYQVPEWNGLAEKHILL